MPGAPGFSTHFKNSRKVAGPGTGTSDSIRRTVPEGTFIMPADSTATVGAQNLAGFGVPGYKKQGVPVNLSNGEYELPPEQVHAVGVQALEAIKDATHQPTGRGVPRKELFFADGGLVEDPEKKQTSFDMTNTTVAGRGAPGWRSPLNAPVQPQPASRLSPQGLQALARDAASRPAQPAPAQQPGAGRGAPGWKTAADGLAGGAKALVGAASVPHAAIADAVRNGATLLAGGDPNTLDGGSAKYRDKAMGTFNEGWKQADAAVQDFRNVAREGLGARPLANTPAPAAATPAGVSAASHVQPDAAPAPAAGRGAPGWRGTGIGADRQGGEIVMRTGTGGVPEFTNEAATPGAVSGAQPAGAPAPGRGLGVPGYGSIDNIGNGVGTFSQAEPGSAQLAYDRNERAIAERAKMLPGIKVAGIGDRGAPTRDEMLRARLDSMEADTEIAQSRARSELNADAQQLQRSGQEMVTEQLNQQRLQQQIEEGSLAAQDRQRLEQLRATIADPNASEEERNAARQAYNVLATQAKDRYITQDVILGMDDNNRPIVGKQVLDVTTGQPVAGAQTAVPSVKAIEALRGDPQLAAEFDQKFGAGASRRYLSEAGI